MKELIKNIQIYFKNYLSKYKKEVVEISILLFFSIMINVFLPIIIGNLIDGLGKGHSIIFFQICIAIYIGILLLKIFIDIVNSYLGEKLGWTISNNLRENLLKHCVENLNYEFYNKHSPGELIERIDGDVTFLANFFSTFIINIVGNTFFIACIIIVFYKNNLYVGLAYSVIAVLAYLVFLSLQNKITILWRRFKENEARLYGSINSFVSNQADIRGVNKSKYIERKIKKRTNSMKKSFAKATFVGNIPTAGFFSLLNIGDVVALGIAVYFYYNSQLSLGTIYLISNYVGLLNRPFIALRYEFENMQKIGAALNRISEIFNIKKEKNNEQFHFNDTSDIEFKNVCFSYENKEVLHNLNFTISCGSALGIIGKTGSGKTTIVRMIANLCNPTSGEIKINNQDISLIFKEEYWKKIYMVNQNSKILFGTIYENITDFTGDISKEEIKSTLKKFNLYDWIEEKECGLDTVVTNETLSSSQIQLLNILKALFSKARIFIFDEINANLDYQTEELIIKALYILKRQCTLIIIAHKLNILQLADYILILDNGKIQEFNEKEKIANKIIEENIE